ncbi:hypothetical protein M0R45_006997 [Rubus argutus]|uniref:Uncharacterized protein n=1 Tax=Rubus argutus TaxID=59490 RepID=A0AAW1YSV6_RUBAR
MHAFFSLYDSILSTPLDSLLFIVLRRVFKPLQPQGPDCSAISVSAQSPYQRASLSLSLISKSPVKIGFREFCTIADGEGRSAEGPSDMQKSDVVTRAGLVLLVDDDDNDDNNDEERGEEFGGVSSWCRQPSFHSSENLKPSKPST